ncbi:uncharacterized protein LOC130820341 isoform X1 [Amaranthus tricolor]|uniref:uncharacterized protein LOC130820341 isoform X1 n=1 Tax=Amaranthus tricolor TaxID=29722 RepID=UPI0025832C7E|nr:uncharacterized protein LOC130820341 isoform X1 [Amaranthus tricolor]
MFSAVKLQTPIPTISHSNFIKADGTLNSSPVILRFPPRRFNVRSHQSSRNVSSAEPSVSSEISSFIGSPSLPPPQLNLSQRHITVLNILACAVACSATWLFISAIPALLAFRRAAESLEKLLDVTREELPDTMAAVRLSGMEISDLTMELSDLGQEITQGVKRSTRVVHTAEEKLRNFANMTSTAPMQEIARPMTTTTLEPAVARSVRGVREGIVKGRTVLQAIFALTGFSRTLASFFSSRSRRRSLNK